MNNKTISYLIFSFILLGTSFYASKAFADEYWDMNVSLYDVLPIGKNDIVFLGNSITDGGEFNELFGRSDIKNRGIRSDAIPGVLKRLRQITEGKPKKIFLLIGINDISHGLSISELTKRYENLVKEIRTQSPDTKVYIQSVMPVNNDFGRYKGLIGKENIIKGLNKEIKKIASDNEAVYIDLWQMLSDNNGKLKKNFTNDGLHLTGAGYKAWTEGIRHYVEE